jgi:hypothetical protein
MGLIHLSPLTGKGRNMHCEFCRDGVPLNDEPGWTHTSLGRTYPCSDRGDGEIDTGSVNNNLRRILRAAMEQECRDVPAPTDRSQWFRDAEQVLG